VPIVVASLWPIESNAAAELMISFHKYRKTESPRASTVQALRLAQLDLIHRAQANSTPNFDWAGFVAIGGYTTF
jgi:CHAT domain-containing protein